MSYFEDVAIGSRREFGSFTFTADEIKRFARKYDPQRFHMSEEEGRKSLFGGLAASGWHVASVYMKLFIADVQRTDSDAAARGEEVAVGGPSPGFRELRWIKPVLAGQPPELQGAVLADLLSLFIAGHAPQLREEILALHIETVRQLVPASEREIFATSERPPDWPRSWFRAMFPLASCVILNSTFNCPSTCSPVALSLDASF